MVETNVYHWVNITKKNIVTSDSNYNYFFFGCCNWSVFTVPFTPKSDLIDFTLSNASRLYSSKGDPLGVKGLIKDLNIL